MHELKVQFPNATITHNGGVRWIGGILYVDDLCLISTDALELQKMINTCQTWSEKEMMRLQLNADKTKIMCFPKKKKNDFGQKPKSCLNVCNHTSPQLRENDHENLMATLSGQCHSTSSPCTQTTPWQPHSAASSLPNICIHTPARSKTI